MTGYLWAALGILAVVFMTAFRGMASDELRDRLDHLPHTILRLAARRLSPAQRTSIYYDEWVPELTYILKGAGARPITRLITGTRYALGILVNAPRIARHLHRELEKAPSDSRRPLAEGSTSEGLAWQLTQAEQPQLWEARRMRDYTHVEDGTGRPYCWIDLTAANPGIDRLSYEWHGVRLPEGRRWKYSKENLDRMYAEGRIEFRKSGRPVDKRYLDEIPAALLQKA
jgi:hypothetical protein